MPWSISISDDDGAFSGLFRELTGARGYSSPEMTATIDSLRSATSDDAKRAAYKRISEVFYRDAPAAVLAARVTFIAHSPRLHGFQPSASSTVLLDKVWLAAS